MIVASVTVTAVIVDSRNTRQLIFILYARSSSHLCIKNHATGKLSKLQLTQANQQKLVRPIVRPAMLINEKVIINKKKVYRLMKQNNLLWQ